MNALDRTSSDPRELALAAALDAVLGPEHRAVVVDLVARETGCGRASSRRVLYWMRVNMPTAAGRVDEALCSRSAWN